MNHLRLETLPTHTPLKCTVANIKAQLELTFKIAPPSVQKRKRQQLNSLLLLYRGFWIIVSKQEEIDILTNGQRSYVPFNFPWRLEIFYPSGSEYVFLWGTYSTWKDAIQSGYTIINNLIEDCELFN